MYASHHPMILAGDDADLIDLKHKYWYMNIPNYGIMATPVDLYTPDDLALARILNGLVTSTFKTLHPVTHSTYSLILTSRSLASGRTQCRRGTLLVPSDAGRSTTSIRTSMAQLDLLLRLGCY